MNRTTIALVWLGGFVLMVVLYAVGTLHFLSACEALLANAWAAMDRLFATLAHKALDAVRAAAVALYVVFVVLTVLARRQGLRTDGLLVTLSLVFLILAGIDWYPPGTRWTAAAALAAVGAGVMTSRLLNPPRRPPLERGSPWARRPFPASGDASQPPE